MVIGFKPNSNFGFCASDFKSIFYGAYRFLKIMIYDC
jgi:hypothetical protein